METTNPFSVALRELVVDNDYVTRNGRPNWAAFASDLKGFHYETLRRAASGRRQPVPLLIEECARARSGSGPSTSSNTASTLPSATSIRLP